MGVSLKGKVYNVFAVMKVEITCDACCSLTRPSSFGTALYLFSLSLSSPPKCFISFHFISWQCLSRCFHNTLPLLQWHLHALPPSPNPSKTEQNTHSRLHSFSLFHGCCSLQRCTLVPCHAPLPMFRHCRP